MILRLYYVLIIMFEHNNNIGLPVIYSEILFIIPDETRI